MGGRRHGLRCVTALALDFGILTETKDSETATVESSFTVTSAYTAEDFVSDARSAFLPALTEDFRRAGRIGGCKSRRWSNRVDNVVV